MNISITFGLGLILLAFVCEYIDSTLGMGYGTTLTPMLLILGFEPLQIIPAVLTSELCTGFLAAFGHNNAGNVDFSIPIKKPKYVMNYIRQNGIKNTFQTSVSKNLKIVILLAFCSTIGSLLGVSIAISIPTVYLKIYIGTLTIIIGTGLLLFGNRKFKFSWKGITSLGILASFNKSISGGGYGPVVTGGQMFSGVEPKNAVAITSFSEGLTCSISIILYLITGTNIEFNLFPYIIIGAILSVPLSVKSVKEMDKREFKSTIAKFTLALGIFTILKQFF